MKKTISVSLPDLPREKEFEEYISAFFQSSGNYIERNITKKGVLELDIIATDYYLSLPKIKLLEVKSGGWGFSDLFKVRGWMYYLKISKGALITRKESSKKSDINFSKEIARKLHIDLVAIPDLDKSKKVLSKLISNRTIEDVDILTWRFSYWVERNLLKHLNHKKRFDPNKKCFKALEDYYFKVNSKIFFTKNIVQKVNELYSTFHEYSHISAKCGNEILGNIFDDECNTVPTQIFQDTYSKCNYNDIQISTFIEHRARLAILKNAVDYMLYRETATNKAKTSDVIKKTSGLKISLLGSLPGSFKNALETISKQKYFYLYPVFWQWFMWIFGGFILKDYENEEYKALSQKTGIPIEEIPNAFEAYQILFPLDGGWFIDLSPTSNIKKLKMFSVPFMGIGAIYRRLLYTESKKFEELKVSGMHTLDDLIKWNNLTVEVLQNGK
jgi:hypothetical protein